MSNISKHKKATPVKSTFPNTASVPALEPEVMAQPGSHGGVTLDEAIRARAYEKWEHAGRPGGDGLSFWLEAEAELKRAS